MMVKTSAPVSSVYLFILLLYTIIITPQPCWGRLGTNVCQSDMEWDLHPQLCQLAQNLMVAKQQDNSPTLYQHQTTQLAQELYDFAKENGWIIDFRDSSSSSSSLQDSTAAALVLPSSTQQRELAAAGLRASSLITTRAVSSVASSEASASSRLPIVLAHGMGDSCFNGGMQHVTKLISEWMDVYAICIPTGGSKADDTNNGFFLNMNDSVEAFYEAIQNHTELRHGFAALGFSQGNNVIRGYITKYNDPPVQTFLSINGVNAGTARVPNCFRSNRWCHFLAESASRSAYTTFAQEHSFQANYWRDPYQYELYIQYSQLAVWNNELPNKNPVWNRNWAKTDHFVWIKASDDEMVYPAESEHWGEPIEDDVILMMKDTRWYQEDWFGLQTADKAGKNSFETFQGSHLQFSLEDLHHWVTKYFG